MTDVAALLDAYPGERPQIEDDLLVICIQEALNCAQACTSCADACAARRTVSTPLFSSASTWSGSTWPGRGDHVLELTGPPGPPAQHAGAR